MRIAIISKSGRNGGGASRVAEDLAQWLNQIGHRTDHYVGLSAGDAGIGGRSLYGDRIAEKICRKTHAATARLGFRELLPIEYLMNLSRVVARYDVVHFHDLHTAISPLTLALVARRKPTFFTVHDCSAFTGGCLYPMGCEKHRGSCQSCPQLPQGGWKNRLRDRSREMQALKRWLAKSSDVRYIFPSNWMEKEASLVLEFKRAPEVIAYGLDLARFRVVEKTEAKRRLGLPLNRPVLVISAHSLDDQRKGIGYALAAIGHVRDLGPVVLAVGVSGDALRKRIGAISGIEVREMGYVADAERLALIYSASDIMLFCSLADNLPLTVLEAMAASVVVVGFAVGGVPEMIRSESNGILVEPGDQRALDQALRRTLCEVDVAAMGRRARSDFDGQFSKAQCVGRHLMAYQSVM